MGLNDVFLSFFVDLFEESFVQVLLQRVENDVFVYFVPLIGQTLERVDFNVEPVQILEEPLHPPDHQDMLLPGFLN